MTARALRPLLGLVLVASIVGVVAVAATLFRGGLSHGVPVTVISPRAGLVMNQDAKVQIRGVQVGKVESIDLIPDGRAAIHLTLDESRMSAIPANVLVNIASSTVFGAKYIQFVNPPEPSPDSLHAGQVLETRHVMVEINTVFEKLTSVLSKIDPPKLNETLGAIASAVNGRGEQIGRTLSDLDAYLTRIEPSLPALNRDLETAPRVLRAYGDAAPDFVTTAENAARISDSIVDQQHNLDAALVSVIGLADVGNQVLGDNGQALTDVLHLLVPTTDLLNRYNQALWCALGGMVDLTHRPPLNRPGVVVLAGFLWGQERYRYPMDLPRAGATGGPQCTGLPKLPFEATPPYVVADTGTNPWRRPYPGIVLNSDLLKKIMFGDIDGPPRNTYQIGQPG